MITIRPHKKVERYLIPYLSARKIGIHRLWPFLCRLDIYFVLGLVHYFPLTCA